MRTEVEKGQKIAAELGHKISELRGLLKDKGGAAADAFEAAGAFLNPVLAGLSNGGWDPGDWSWTPDEE